MKFKEAKGRGVAGAEGPVAHSIYQRSGVRALILFSSFQLAENLHFLPPCWNCLFIPLSFKEPLVAMPPPPSFSTPQLLTTHPLEFSPHLCSPIAFNLRFFFFFHSFIVEGGRFSFSENPQHLIFRYTETILHLRRDYASLADNRKYAIE